MSRQPVITKTRELLCSLSTTLAAELCGIDPRHFRKLISDGHLPKAVGGKVDAFKTLERHRHYLMAGRVPGVRGDIRKETEIERHRKLKLANDEKDKALIPIDQFRSVTDTMASIYVQGLESLPGRLANLVAGESEPAVVRKILQDEVRRIRRGVAEAQLGPLGAGMRGSDSDAAAGQDAGSVG